MVTHLAGRQGAAVEPRQLRQGGLPVEEAGVVAPDQLDA